MGKSLSFPRHLLCQASSSEPHPCLANRTPGQEALEQLRSRLHPTLQSLQFPPRASCACRRVLLYTGHYYEGFACAVHQLGLALQAALASGRTLVVLDKVRWICTRAKAKAKRTKCAPAGVRCTGDAGNWRHVGGDGHGIQKQYHSR